MGNDKTFLNKWFQNEKNTAMVQVISSFCFGILLSPWSSGLFFLVIYTILYEIIYYIFTKGDPFYYSVFVRTGVICSSILGFIVGRTLSGCQVLNAGVPDMPNI